MGHTSEAAAEFRTLGVVLAGGRSTRMGRDKARMAWPDPAGLPLFEHAAGILDAHCDVVEVSVGTSEELAKVCAGRWGTLADGAAGSGPLAGLVTALERSQAGGFDAILILACDVPLVAPEDLSTLLTSVATGADAAYWRTQEADGRSVEHPLVAAYRSSLAPLARAAFDRGERKVTSFLTDPLPDGRTPRVERRSADQNSALRLVNVNTESDYDRARKRALGTDASALDAP